MSRTHPTKNLMQALLDGKGQKYIIGVKRTKEGASGYLLFNKLVLDKNGIQFYLLDEHVAYVNADCLPNFEKGETFTFSLDEGIMRINLK